MIVIYVYSCVQYNAYLGLLNIYDFYMYVFHINLASNHANSVMAF